MEIIVKGKPLRYKGKLYLTGDAANVSRQHARVLTAIKRAEMPAPKQPAKQPQTRTEDALPQSANAELDASAPQVNQESSPQQENEVSPSAQPRVPLQRVPLQRVPRVSRDPKAKAPK